MVQKASLPLPTAERDIHHNKRRCIKERASPMPTNTHPGLLSIHPGPRINRRKDQDCNWAWRRGATGGAKKRNESVSPTASELSRVLSRSMARDRLLFYRYIARCPPLCAIGMRSSMPRLSPSRHAMKSEAANRNALARLSPGELQCTSLKAPSGAQNWETRHTLEQPL